MSPLFRWWNQLRPVGQSENPPKANHEQEFRELENRLQDVLQPVTPRPTFVKDLRRRLVSYPAPAAKTPASKIPQYVFVAVASFLSGTFLLVLGIWAIKALVTALVMMRQRRLALSPRPLV